MEVDGLLFSTLGKLFHAKRVRWRPVEMICKVILCVGARGSNSCGRGRGDGGVSLDGVVGPDKGCTLCFEGLKIKIHVLVTLDREIVFRGGLFTIKAACLKQSNQD